MKLDKKNPHCRYCGGRATLSNGAEVYENRPDLQHVNIWSCRPCGARVGCHPGTITPHGHLADADTRAARRMAHQVFDKLWKDGNMSRGSAYKWLAKEMGLNKKVCHIGSFDVEKCEKAIELSSMKR